MTELKPCPFCGKKAQVVNMSTLNSFGVCRTRCHASIQIQETSKEAIKAWNTRVGDEDASHA